MSAEKSAEAPRTPPEWAQELVRRLNADPCCVAPNRIGFTLDVPISGHVAEIIRAALAARDAEVLPVLRELFDAIENPAVYIEGPATATRPLRKAIARARALLSEGKPGK